MNNNNCEYCLNYTYDEFRGTYFCQIELDEDEMEKYISNSYYNCPHFHINEYEYTILKKQN